MEKMNIYLTVGNVSVIVSRIILLILSSLAVWQWTSIIIGIHFLVMLGWIIEQKSNLNRNENWDVLSYLQLSFRYCFYFHYLKNGNLGWRRRSFNFLLFLEGAALLILYLVNSRHGVLVQAFGSGFFCVTFLVGIVFLEYDTYCYEKPQNTTDEEQGNGKPNSEDSEDRSTLNGGKSELKNSSNSASNDKETTVSLRKGRSPNCSYDEKEVNSEPLVPLGNNKRETMCSIQDLLANTSVLNSLFDCEETEVTTDIGKETQTIADVGEHQGNCSINEVGLPIMDDFGSTSSSSSHSYSKNSIPHEIVDPVSSYKCNFGASNCNNSKISASNSINSTNNTIDEKKMVIETSENMVQSLSANQIRTSADNFDYENIYDAVPVEDSSKLDEDYTYIQPFMPKPLYLLQSADESIAAQSTGSSHDYENIPAINVYRANTGVRHWKTYLDIEDNVHDYSTFKERSEIQDSTYVSNLYVTNVSNSRPFSLAEKVGSHYSMSLPDLSNIAPATCIEVESVMAPDVHADNKEEFKDNALTNRGEDPSNYETIWYEDLNRDQNLRVDNGSKLVIGEDGKIQESLCNLYYSRLSDLSSKYFAYGIKRHNSMSTLFSATTEEARGFQLSKPQFLFEVNSKEIVSSLASSSSTPKGKKIESKRTQKSPLMKLVALSQNSLHEHTAKALQAGKRVFYRPRIHEITPKKETQGVQRRISLKVNSSEEDQANHFKVDPNILKKRSQLSPKDKLILSEASALIRKREITQSLKEKRESKLNNHAEESSKSSPEQLPLNLETTDILDSVPKDDEDGPQHSTPEGNRHLPQMSILSSISSVASPEETQTLQMENVFSKKSSGSFIGESSSSKRKSSSRLLQNGKRCSSKILNEMSVIQEFETIPYQV